MSDAVPPTRWETTYPDAGSPYARNFEDLIARGEDIDGEARLADVLLPRGGRVLDAGSGLGRVAAALRARGHDVTAVEKDPHLVARSRELFPDVPVVVADILELTPALLGSQGRPSAYDLVVAVGNVVVYLADGTETRALRTLADLLVPGGRVLLGWHPQEGPPGSRDYPLELFREHLRGTGLLLEHVFGGYDLSNPVDEYVVTVLRSST